MTNAEITIEELLNTIPLKITKNIEDTCYSCGCKHQKRCQYNFKIELIQHEIRPNVVKKRFKMYYETSSFSNGDSRKFIGHSTGLGFLTMREAFDELKGYLND